MRDAEFYGDFLGCFRAPSTYFAILSRLSEQPTWNHIYGERPESIPLELTQVASPCF